MSSETRILATEALHTFEEINASCNRGGRGQWFLTVFRKIRVFRSYELAVPSNESEAEGIKEDLMNRKLKTLLATLTVAALPLVFANAAKAQGQPTPNQFWWPDRIDLSPLRQHAAESNPLGPQFDYAKAFATLDLKPLRRTSKRS
jgi:hypothetical protein